MNCGAALTQFSGNVLKKKIILALIGLIALAIAVWTVRSRVFSTAEEGGRVFVSGSFEAVEVDLAFRIAGQIKTLPISEGDKIRGGQVVASLDTDTLETAQAGAKAEMAVARATLDELEEGTRKEVIAAARAALDSAKSRLVNAKAEFDRHAPLYKQGVISGTVFDAKETALRVAQADVDNASQRLKELEVGPREEQIRAAKARYERAQWELKKIELDLKHSNLETPVSGLVLVKANEEGEVVLPGATVATVAALDEVWLKGYVGEKFLGRVKLGQDADISTDSYPGKVYRGKVTFISPRAEFTPKNVQTQEERTKQVYRVKITIANPDYELKIGMPAEGYILTNQPAEGDPKVQGR
jgi:HlyD family secretion protein